MHRRAGGSTCQWAEGVLSEVFWTGSLMNLPDLGHKGAALANGGQYLHNSCGGGVFGAALTVGVATKLDLLPDNVTAMARVLGAANKQYLSGLFSDKLGF